MSRYVTKYIKEFLPNKILFISGPRQVGKTTLAIFFLKNPTSRHPAYFNWDFEPNRKALLKNEIPENEPIIILDEIHKYPKWRNFLKGLYDHYKDEKSWLVTGSARLDHFSRGGDSLLGRSFFCRVHPFDLCELNDYSSEALDRLLSVSGFPEPYTKKTLRFYNVWSQERIRKVIKEDLRDLERVHEISKIELMVDSLRDRAAQTITNKSLAEDLAVSPHTVENWLKMQERLYLIYRLSPFGSNKIKAVKKEQKLFFWDWSMSSENDSHRFENLVGSHLLKLCHFREDTYGEKFELRYIKNSIHQEVDFVVLKNKKPVFAVECKTGENSLSSRLKYFKTRLDIPEAYQVHRGTRDYGTAKLDGRVLPFVKFAEEILAPYYD